MKNADNLSQLQNFFNNGKLLPNNIINLSSIKKNKLLNKKYKKLKILGGGEIKNKIQIEVNSISNGAKTKIEKTGGKVSLLSNKN